MSLSQNIKGGGELLGLNFTGLLRAVCIAFVQNEVEMPLNVLF